MRSPCVANVIVPVSRLRYLKDKEQERRRCSEQRVQKKGWGTKKRERTEKKMSKGVHMVPSDTQVLGAVLFQPNAESHLCIKQKNRVRKYNPSLFFPATICSGSLYFFLFNLPSLLFHNPPSLLPSFFPSNVIWRSVSGIFWPERNAKADCRLSFCRPWS